uniref:Uncharacterized protein n=1 Tax=Romanomermis culicivorax TaxID=13658 RepID=A0A915K1Y8_ROMCU
MAARNTSTNGKVRKNKENNKTELLYKRQWQINGDGSDVCPRQNVGASGNHHGHCSSIRGIGRHDSLEGRGDYRNGHCTDSIAKDRGCSRDGHHRLCSGMMTCMFVLKSAVADWFQAEESAVEP